MPIENERKYVLRDFQAVYDNMHLGMHRTQSTVGHYRNPWRLDQGTSPATRASGISGRATRQSASLFSRINS